MSIKGNKGTQNDIKIIKNCGDSMLIWFSWLPCQRNILSISSTLKTEAVVSSEVFVSI
jgi:hypothetical protein